MNEIIKLDRATSFKSESDFHYNFISSFKEIIGIHCHTFFEIFLIFRGRVIHCINGKKQPLCEGSLVFIRPDDIHYYEKDGESDFQVINLAFTREMIEGLFNYFGHSTSLNSIVKAEELPDVTLTSTDRESLLYRFERLNILPSSNLLEINIELKVLLSELILYFLPYYLWREKSMLPDWLEHICKLMELKENFVDGHTKIQQLTGRTPEYICRTFKKYFDLTPTEYVNQLRLNYAKNLLMNSDESIIDICFNSGFENLSHFYHCFKKQYNFSPSVFRKINARNPIL